MYDAELAMMYYNYRYYNPMDGRWINRDTMAEEDSYNFYLFIYHNPQNLDKLKLVGYFPYAPRVMNPKSTYDSTDYRNSPLKEINTAFKAVQHYRSIQEVIFQLGKTTSSNKK